MNNMDLYEHILYRMISLANETEVNAQTKKVKSNPLWILIFNSKRLHPDGKYTAV